MKLPLFTPTRRTLLHTTLATALASLAPRSFAALFGQPRALQGPMIGAPGPSHFTVWVRASAACEVQLEYSPTPDFTQVLLGGKQTASECTDHCVALRAEGLSPGTRYWYRLRYAGQLDPYQPLPFATRTAPAGPAAFRVAFGSCARIQFDPDQRIFDVVNRLEPDLFFWLGGNIYADSDQPQAMADLYRRGRNVRSLEPLLCSVPQLAIWDDHDFAYNDSDAGNPIKAESLALFRHYWANPAFGEDGAPGVYFRQHYGGVDFFFLDGRYHRDPSHAPAGPGKTMLGARQNAWLKRALKDSGAPFKVLVSAPTPAFALLPASGSTDQYPP